ncbi:MAG: SDR family NAD(P)-dependent oxidoreductase [Bacillota bacterium]
MGSALITGASSGIGLATARLLAARGWRLFLVGRSPERLEAAAGNLGARLLEADLAEPGAARRLAAAMEAEADGLELLVNGAGQLEVGPAEGGAAERLIQVNCLGAIRLIEACLPLLRRGRRPCIVNLSSVAGRIAPPYMAAYAASKAALTAYSHALRQELRPQGIHVGLVLPGPVATPMVQGLLGGPHYPLPPGLPVLRADEVARAVLAVAERRLAEVILPRRLGVAARLASAFPLLVDQLYRRIGRRQEEVGTRCGA